MPHSLPPLPYPHDALAPHISERTLSFHYDKHHAGYVRRVNAAIADTPDADLPLEQLVLKVAPDQTAASPAPSSKLFNGAAQALNHAFYWNSMSPDGGGDPTGELAAAIEQDFGSADGWREQFASGAAGNFASGWGWLVRRPTDGRLLVVQTNDAHTPLIDGLQPLAVIDVWEHAYYLDYQNDRKAYINGFVEHLINWEFVAANYAAAVHEG